MILRMTWEPNQRNSVIPGFNERLLKESSRSWQSLARKVGQNRDKSEVIPAVIIPKGLAMAARGRFQDAEATEAAEISFQDK